MQNVSCDPTEAGARCPKGGAIAGRSILKACGWEHTGCPHASIQSKPVLKRQAATLVRRGGRSRSPVGSRLALLLSRSFMASHEHQEKLMSSRQLVLCNPGRTAIGAFNGALKSVSAVDLGATVVRETLKRTKVDAAQVGSVVMGNVIQAGNKMNPARQAAIGGGLPVS